MARVILIRHTAVAAHWKGRCYGRSDAGLSLEGRRHAATLAVEYAHGLVADGAISIVSSPLRRARLLAARIARHAKLPLVLEPRLMECDFGTWEGQSWDAIWRASGNAMMGMILSPSTFRPGGSGETTHEVRDRAMAWLREQTGGETVAAICHGGPIAAIRGTLDGRSVSAWPGLVPGYGERLVIEV